MPNYCAMKNCSSKGNINKQRSFYRFPLDVPRSKAWVEACGRSEVEKHSVEHLNKSAHVCDLHFKTSDRYKTRLKVDAVPFPYDQVPKETKSTQADIALTSDSEADNENEPSTSSNILKGKGARKNQQIRKLLIKVRNLSDEKCRLNSELIKLFDLQTELDKLSKDKKCAKKLYAYALNLYIACPATYKTIRMSLTLPSEKVLRKAKLEIDSMMSNDVMINLRAKMASLEPVNRYCSVSLQKMPLRRFLFYHINRDKVIGFRNINGDETLEPATYAYTLMARGLNAKWEQLIAYCFLAENDDKSSIDPWLDSVLKLLVFIQCEVVALVVDHEDLYDHFRNRIRSITEPYIRISNVHRKVYCIFDLPQLIISLRNTLMTHELQFQDNDGSLVIADWKTIEALYSRTRKANECVVPKLTNSHIQPNESEKIQLKYAAEVFSKSMAEALDMESKRHTENYSRLRGTRQLIALVNDVFDILNSSAVNHHKKCKNAFTGESHQMKAIRLFMEFLTNVKPLNNTNVDKTSLSCIYGLRISIMSFSIILRDLLPKGIKALVTHRFNLNAINDFFNFVRQKSNSEKPSPIQFYKYFRNKFMVQLMKYPGTVSRKDSLLHFINRINFRLLTRRKMASDDFKKTIEVETVDYRFDLPTSNSFHFTCWYLLKKCFEAHPSSCDQFRRFLHENVTGINWKSYCWNSYFKPPDIFIDIIKVLDEQLDHSFGNRLSVGLGTGILMILKELKLDLICPCFPIIFLRRLFVRMRIFHIIRYNNKRLSDDTFTFSRTDYYNIDVL